jgi:hypothetical protein
MANMTSTTRTTTTIEIRRHALAVLLLSAMLSTGCPERSSGGSAGPPKICTRLAEQCTLPSGALGVCSDTPCPAGREWPCLACTSQH